MIWRGMRLTHLRVADYRVQSWRNGRGETREIATDGGEPYGWRLSWASVAESGAFSRFAGYQRVIVLLAGGPIQLSHDGAPLRPIERLVPHLFSGAAATHAEVAQPSEDLNLFTRVGQARGTALAWSLPRAGAARILHPGGREHFLFCAEGSVLAAGVTLARRETLRVSCEAERGDVEVRVEAVAPADGLWITIE
jgi:environmental stress-induced protein Ves